MNTNETISVNNLIAYSNEFVSIEKSTNGYVVWNEVTGLQIDRLFATASEAVEFATRLSARYSNLSSY